MRFIKRAQGLGFSLSEVGELLSLDQTSACEASHDLAAHNLVLVAQKMNDLAAIRQVLVDLERQCEAADGGANCPIIDALKRE